MVFPYPLTNHIAIRARVPSEVEAELIALFRMRLHDVHWNPGQNGGKETVKNKKRGT